MMDYLNYFSYFCVIWFIIYMSIAIVRCTNKSS